MSNDILSRYERAQTIMNGYQTNSMVMNDAVHAHWIPSIGETSSDCFWYKKNTKNGKEFRIVNPKSSTNQLAFCHSSLAEALARETGNNINSQNLPFHEINMSESPTKIKFHYSGKYWEFSPKKNSCSVIEEHGKRKHLASPDKKKSLYVDNWNLWIRDEITGEERALTTDGEQDFSYGSSYLNIDSTIQALWSPDSKLIYTVQLDSRKVATRTIITYVPSDEGLHPTLTHFKTAYPGDDEVECYHLLVIDADSGECRRVNYPPLPYVMHGPETFDGFFTGSLGWWSNDCKNAYFVDLARGNKKISVVKWNTQTSEASVLFEESAETFVKLCEDSFSCPEFLPLPDSNELIWYSERSGWAHLYLYELEAGTLKHQITEGQWLVRGILHYDKKHRELLVQTAGRDSSYSPYYRDICKVNIDSGKVSQLIGGPFDHITYSDKHPGVVLNRGYHKVKKADSIFAVSPSGEYILTTFSRVDTPPTTVLISKHGEKVMTVETADISGIPAWWNWPEPIKVKAADNKTDMYGVIFRPPGFNPEKRYPIVDFLGAMRFINLIPDGSFTNSHFTNYYEMAALSALGFIVIGVAGRGSALRDKHFQDYAYGSHGGEDSLEDHIAAIHQLCNQYSYMDIERVGITAMEASNNVVYGLLKHSDFYKVAVSHVFRDPRDSIFHLAGYYNIYDKNSIKEHGGPEEYVKSFNGKLLLINGLSNAADSTFRLVEALQKEGKCFDMLSLPNLTMQVTSYTRKRGWDYLVTHLQNIKPPIDFKLDEPMALGSGWDVDDFDNQ